VNRLSVRVRLTLLYSVVFFLCGSAVIAISYLLVASQPLPQVNVPIVDQKFQVLCHDPERLTQAPSDVRDYCSQVYSQGVTEGARKQRDVILARLLRYSAITLVTVTVLAALGGWLMAGRTLRPIHRITQAARDASEHNLSARVALSGPRDELRELADTFDAMLARMEASFLSQRRFIANAGHELRTPLAVMGATVDVVLAKPAPSHDELLAMGRDIRSGVDQADAVVAALLTLARNNHGLGVREPVDLATVAEDVLDGTEAGDRRVHADLESAPVMGDPVLLERLVANLVDNALRYNWPGGGIWLHTSIVDGRAVFEIANSGPEVSPGRIGDLFQPFQRLHDGRPRDGLGLGLAIVASIATAHGGTVTAVPRDEGGLIITATLPLSS
jgi:signal transduction histidine kinase